MFCPRCGTENNSERKFCHKCGQGLTSVRLAMVGRVDQAITTLAAEQKLSVHRTRIVISVFLILIAVATLLTGGRVGIANIASAAGLLIFIVIFFLQLVLKTRRVANLLNPEAEVTELKIDQKTTSGNPLPEAKTAVLNAPAAETPMSVAERTTLKLNSDN